MENKYQILVVDDEAYICSIVTEALSANETYQVVSFCDPKQALDFVEKNHVDLVLTDLLMGDFSGVTMLDQTLRCHPDCVVLLMTAHPTVNNAISVLRKGAYDYLVKPFKLETLRNTVKRGLEHQQLTRENLHLREQLALYKLSEDMDVSTDLQTSLQVAVETAQSVVGVGAVSILVKDNPSKAPVPYLIIGSDSHPESDCFLQGDHQLCREAMTVRESRVENREIEGNRKGIRSFATHPLVWRGEAIGLLNVIQEDPFMGLRPGQLHLLSIIASKVAAAIENNRLYDNLQASYLKTIKALANAIEARDRYTRGHTDRVTMLADLIAVRMNWSDRQRAELKMGCTLHDIGKIGIPDAILTKPEQLTEEEWQRMEEHPKLGARILEGIDYLAPAIPYILYHHEKYDGTGYPHGLAGEDIPVEGRLLMIVDTYDAIVSERPYRREAPPEKAIEELEKYKGKQFDPLIVDILVGVWREGLIDRLALYANRSAIQPTV